MSCQIGMASQFFTPILCPFGHLHCGNRIDILVENQLIEARRDAGLLPCEVMYAAVDRVFDGASPYDLLLGVEDFDYSTYKSIAAAVAPIEDSNASNILHAAQVNHPPRIPGIVVGMSDRTVRVNLVCVSIVTSLSLTSSVDR